MDFENLKGRILGSKFLAIENEFKFGFRMIHLKLVFNLVQLN